jgi:hypothetical protein
MARERAGIALIIVGMFLSGMGSLIVGPLIVFVGFQLAQGG